MNTYDDYTDMPGLFDCLQEIVAELVQSANQHRHPKATFFGGLNAYLTLLREKEVEVSLEAVAQLEMMCTVSAI